VPEAESLESAELLRYDGLQDTTTHTCPAPVKSGLDDWTLVHLPRPDKVIDGTKDGDCACDQDAVVHGLRVNRGDRRPEAKEQHNDQVDARHSVVDDAQCTRDVPISPNQLCTSRIGEGR